MNNLDIAIIKVQQKGKVNEWLWRLVVDHNYKFNKINPDLGDAFKYWVRNVKNTKND